MSLTEISDRLEIQDLLVDYCHAVDTRSWDALDDVFTTDAVIDYTEMGGTRGTVAETKKFLAEVMPLFSGFQHMISTSKVVVDGDTATGKTICHNPMLRTADDGSTQVFLCGLWYRDAFVRTPAGWRIQARHEERCYLPTLLGT
ncbi:nuclear transport factor 2 family protein [Rhodococcus sp. X156]|uniref:nuclear transport factor 2 family protein n=1 Tax=Rhodococcus sp. X156 TaxID=2499145 RepID=UPI000FD9B10D|nr:nuclear transport factor 2 family protein [Rhodococcus sp. X156]